MRTIFGLTAIIIGACWASIFAESGTAEPGSAESKPAEIVGRVFDISDGDTVVVKSDKKSIKVRLEGIDAPERRQPCGDKARQALAKRIRHKQARVTISGRDRFGRSVGTVWVDGENINYWLVESGLAWHDKRFSDSEGLANTEAKARKAKAGLWSGSSAPVPPWEWREYSDEQKTAARQRPPPEEKTTVTVAGDAGPEQVDLGGLTVYVPKSGSKYHRAGCRHLRDKVAMPLKRAVVRHVPCETCSPPTLTSLFGSIGDPEAAKPAADPARKDKRTKGTRPRGRR